MTSDEKIQSLPSCFHSEWRSNKWDQTYPTDLQREFPTYLIIVWKSGLKMISPLPFEKLLSLPIEEHKLHMAEEGASRRLHNLGLWF